MELAKLQQKSQDMGNQDHVALLLRQQDGGIIVSSGKTLSVERDRASRERINMNKNMDLQDMDTSLLLEDKITPVKKSSQVKKDAIMQTSGKVNTQNILP